MTGLIFAAIAVLLLTYLVPLLLHRGEAALEVGEASQVPVSEEITIVRAGVPLTEPNPAAVSTPLTRRAQLRELHARDVRAARRRRRVLLVLVLALLGVSGGAAVGVLLWWAPLIPAGLIITFLVVARFSVRTLRAKLAEQARLINSGEAGEETVAIALSAAQDAQNEHSVELSIPIPALGSLWDPIPITRETYVSKPLAARTVRTIDLSAPVPAASRIPVTADPVGSAVPDADSAEDVG